MTEIDGTYVILLLISTSTTLYLKYCSLNKRSNHDAQYFSFLKLMVSTYPLLMRILRNTNLKKNGVSV